MVAARDRIMADAIRGRAGSRLVFMLACHIPYTNPPMWARASSPVRRPTGEDARRYIAIDYPGNALLPRPVLDPYRRSHKSEGAADLVFQEALIREVQLHLAVGEEHERGWSDGGLCHVIDLHLLAGGDRGAVEIHALQKAVHLAGSNALAALRCDLLQRGKYLFHALAGGGGNKQHRRVAEELQRITQSLFVGSSISRHLLVWCGRPRPHLLLAGSGARAAPQVPLVHDDDDRASALMGIAGDRRVQLADAFGGVNHQQRDVGGFEVLARHHHGELLGHQMSLAFAADAGRINEAEALAVALDHFVDRVAGGAREGRDDGAISPGEPI